MLLLVCVSLEAAPAIIPAPPQLAATGYLLLDAKTGKSLWSYPMKFENGVPNSPMVMEGKLIFGDDHLKALDAKTGKEHWRERSSGNHGASPTFVGGRLLFHSKEGETTVLKPGRKFKILARNKLDGAHHASAAVSDDALFLRTEKAIYKIEKQ